jgi:predicted ATP-dependent serine protease
MHGLPPLSAYFVMRKKPMEAIINGLINKDMVGQRVMIISGLGGIGKTQLALKFARSFQERYESLHVVVQASNTFQLPAYPLRRRQFHRQFTERTFLTGSIDECRTSA